ncbi:hypothetical protein [Sulfurisphaera ohwakuensis]|uniref:Putative Fe-Mo cluster-binding NifX family protein n=1 Tax=Sulfurisphaera ohwakuensis TaxID=69656 RepID=A0A650CK14_SULOH|nr:hypothetical protein [Sulfurisphaera ohwakuensis]MBB5254635.1 putative Fe-Mo cluster-binding NifX family protein [Sulfurisphaera ohwakuensis]QGR18025.1 hypothetical protein D1869_13140 [Sulfurisphaera ohwakuensis]
MITCTTVLDDLKTLEEFSKARYLILLDENTKEIIYKEDNPALHSKAKRPSVAKECVKLKADKVIAPHGSLCYPSYMILKKANINILISNVHDTLDSPELREVSIKEIIYSSFQAILERIKGEG